MPAPSRNEVAEKHRAQRRESSPYNQRGRKDKMAASRGWRPTIWKALTFWRSEDMQSSDEDSDPSEEVSDPNVGENGKDPGTRAQEEVVEDGNDVDSSSMMNSSIVSEDQVFRQLISPTPRQVRFQLPSPSLNSRRISPFQSGPSVPFTSRRQQPYVAPLPPSSSLIKTREDPLGKVSQYLDNVIRPRGGEVSDVEAMGLTMLIQSAVKGDYSQKPLRKPSSDHYLLGTNSVTSTPSRDVSPNHNPFVFPMPETPLKPTFTTPNTNFAAIFSQPDTTTTTTTTTTTSTTRGASSSRSLTRNPNGNVMFQGGGSAKSRYRSSAFGTPSSRKKVTFSRDFGESKIGSSNGISNLTSSTSDGKRRRIDEESSSSAAASSTPFFQTSSSSSFDSQTKETGTRTTNLNGHGTVGTSRAQAPVPAPSNIRLGGSNNRFTSTTPVRPSPLRQSMRADSSSPGSPSSNRGTPEAKTNGKIAKQSGEAKALAIMTEIIQSASRPKDEQASLNPDITNPYDTRPASKRARKSTKPARPPPRPVRRTVSAEVPPPTQSPRKPTALETIEQSAPSSVQAQSKRVHAEMTGSSQSHKPKRPSPVNHDVIEIDDDEEDEQPPAKRAKPEKTKPLEPIKESVEIIDIDGDVDMTTPAPASSTNNVLRPSEIVEPTESDASDTSKPAVSRTLYPTSLSKASGGFGVTPKKPSPLRNSFQPESDSSTPTNVASSKPKQPEATTTSLFGSAFTTTPAFPTTSNGESSQVSSASSSFSSTTTTTATSLFGGGSTFSFESASSNTSFSSVPKFGASSTEDKIFTTTPSTNGFTFGRAPAVSTSNAIVSTGVTKPFQFGASSSAFVPPAGAFKKSANVEDDEEAIKKVVLAMNLSALPVFRFTIPSVVMNGEHSAERNAALALPVESLPKFTFDTGFVLKPAPLVKPQKAAPVPPPKMEAKGFDWSAAGMKAPASSGWTCSVCSVPNKVSDSKCVCCGENAPVPKTEVKGFDWSASGMKAPVSSGWTCRVCAVPNKSFDSKCVCCGENKP